MLASDRARLMASVRYDRMAAKIREQAADIQFWRNYAALFPYAVRVDRDAEAAARALTRIPTQRRPVDLWPRVAPTGTPAKPNTKWGTRSHR